MEEIRYICIYEKMLGLDTRLTVVMRLYECIFFHCP